MPLSAEQNERYLRQIALPEIGPTGQERLLRAGVLVVGTGGLGSSACYYLAAAGIGRLGLADGDRVELSNLQRQILHATPDLGRPKVESAHDKLSALNPEVQVEAIFSRVTAENAAQLIARYDAVIAATDNLATRRLLNETCYQTGKPLIEGAVRGFTGHLITFLPPRGPCYQCLFPERGGSVERPAGVLGAVPGVIGAMQAIEAIKVLLGLGQPMTGRLLVFDALAGEFTTVALTANPSCPVCRAGNVQPGDVPGCPL